MTQLSDTMLAASFLPGLAAVGLGALLAFLLGRRRYAGWPGPWLPAGPLTYGSASERREWFRRKGARVRVSIADVDGKEPRGSGWVIDRSTGGLCLEVQRALAAGSIVSIRPVHATSAMPWVQVEVKSSRERDGGWEVGCRFVRRPSWQVRLLFG